MTRRVYERRAKAQKTADLVKAVAWLKGHGNRRYASMMLAVLTAELASRGFEWVVS